MAVRRYVQLLTLRIATCVYWSQGDKAKLKAYHSGVGRYIAPSSGQTGKRVRPAQQAESLAQASGSKKSKLQSLGDFSTW